MSDVSGEGATVAIVTALAEEFRPIRAKLTARRAETVSGRRISIGRIGAWSCTLMEGGEGLISARESARLLLDFSKAAALIGAGVAGGISPGLRCGDVLAGARVVGPGPSAYRGDPEWLQRARRAGAREGLLVTQDRLVLMVEAKALLWRSVESADPAAVDLESSGWAEAADRAHVKFLAVRSVADRAEDDLPALLSRSRDSSGSTDRTRVALQALRRPGSIAGLVRLARRTYLASARLAETLENLLSDIGP